MIYSFSENIRSDRFMKLTALLMFFFSYSVHAQKKNIFDRFQEQIDSTKKLVASAKKLAKTLDDLSDMSSMNTADFNKNVTVVEGTKGNKTSYPPGITKNEITQLQYHNNKFTNLEWSPVAFFDNNLFIILELILLIKKH